MFFLLHANLNHWAPSKNWSKCYPKKTKIWTNLWWKPLYNKISLIKVYLKVKLVKDIRFLRNNGLKRWLRISLTILSFLNKKEDMQGNHPNSFISIMKLTKSFYNDLWISIFISRSYYPQFTLSKYFTYRKFNIDYVINYQRVLILY